MIKTLFKFGLFVTLVGGALAGGTILVAGSHRAKAVVHQLTGDVRAAIDSAIDDPTALRQQLAELEREYPERIAAVRADLAELNQEIRQLEREKAVSERVVAMVSEDIAALEPLVQEAATRTASDGRAIPVAFDHRVMSLRRATAKLDELRATEVAYRNRAADADHDLAYLRQQAERLEQLQTQLETERAQFQSQIWQLSRQVDAIARNERLIALLEKRNRTIEECSRYDAASLEQITAQLARVRTRQEAELDTLTGTGSQIDYEERARLELRSRGAGRTPSRPAASLPATALAAGTDR